MWDWLPLSRGSAIYAPVAIFCPSANHSSVWFEVDGQEMAAVCACPPKGAQLGPSIGVRMAGAFVRERFADFKGVLIWLNAEISSSLQNMAAK